MKLLSSKRYLELIEKEKSLTIEEKSKDYYERLYKKDKLKINTLENSLETSNEEIKNLKNSISNFKEQLQNRNKEILSLKGTNLVNIKYKKNLKNNNANLLKLLKEKKEEVNSASKYIEELEEKFSKQSMLYENIKLENDNLRNQIIQFKPHSKMEYANNGLRKSQRKLKSR